MTLTNQKHLFSIRENVHYLNCAYKAPLLKSNEDIAIKALRKERNPIDIAPIDFFTEVEEVRIAFSKIINCSPSEVAIMPSSSYGFSSALNNISCKTIQGKKQHAITIESEFPSDYFSIKRWCKTHDAALKIIAPDKDLDVIGQNWNAKILDAINEETAVVIMSTIHWMNGLKFDLEAIGQKCRSVGAKFIVDGSQSVGAMSMDVKKYNIDALIGVCYKWLFGPYSVALAYMSPVFNDGIPLEESWMNRTNAKDFSNLANYDSNYMPDAGRYNVGQASKFILMPMLHNSLNQIIDWSVSGIQNYCGELIQPLLNYIQNLGIQLEEPRYFSNHLFGLKLPNSVDTNVLKENFAKHNVYLSVRGDSLRVSVNVFNTKEDIAKLIEVIEETRT